MKGIVFNLLETVVIQHHGDQVWDAMLESSGLDGSYTSLGSYPDAELVQLVQAAAAQLDKSPAEILQWFGRRSMSVLSQRYPAFFEPHTTARTFILSLNSIIHPEVRKIYPGADVPEFEFDDSNTDVLLMGYQSHRRLCALAHGFIEGAADFYGETLSLNHAKCMHHGDPACLLEITLS